MITNNCDFSVSVLRDMLFYGVIYFMVLYILRYYIRCIFELEVLNKEMTSRSLVGQPHVLYKITHEHR